MRMEDHPVNFNVHTIKELYAAWHKVRPGDTITLFVEHKLDYAELWNMSKWSRENEVPAGKGEWSGCAC
jgi:hypothetical protein